MKYKFFLLIFVFILMNAPLSWGADSYIGDLTADASPSSDDVIETEDDPGGTPASKKVTLGNLLAAGNSGINAGTDITADLEEETHASEHESGGADELNLDGMIFSGATPEWIFKDSDATDSDNNAGVDGNLTDTGSGSEDMDVNIYVQSGGTKTNVIEIDADGGTGSIPAIKIPSGAELQISSFTTTESEFLPIGWALDGGTAPEAKSTLTSTNSVEIRNFDDAQDEDVQIPWQVPIDIVAGSGIKFRVVCWISNATGPSTEGVSFFLQGASVGNGDILSSALGTAVESNIIDQTHAQYDVMYTDWSSAVTVTGLAAGEHAILKLYRDISDADDDYAQDIGVSGIEIKYERTHDASF